VVLAHGVLHSGLLDLSPVLHRQVLEQLDDGVIVLDAEGRIIDVNASAAAMLMPDGGTADILGVAIDTLLPGQALSRLISSPERVLETEVDLTSYEVRATRLDAGGGSSATVLVFRDVTRRLAAEGELKRAKQEMERLAYTDPLTGLQNRRAFVSRLQEECDRVRRFDQQLSIVLLDLDRFKQVNDTWGHETGDTVLRHVAEELHGCSRTCDVAGRLGGEEFALLLPGSGADGALRVAERLREAVRRHRPAADAEPVTVSIGVATVDPDAPDWQALLRAADEALYAAKHAGRDTVRSAAPN
jgi:diguanylate cyclase (GGDEF)-like protein